MSSDDAQQALAAFGGELRQLRKMAGNPSFRELEKLTDGWEWSLPRSTTSEKLRGKSVPEWEFVKSFISACKSHAETNKLYLSVTLTAENCWERKYEEMLQTVKGDRRTAQWGKKAEAELTKLRVPQQLPQQARHFSGRVTVLESLTRQLELTAESGGTMVISALDGTAGVGKTTVAVRWAHQVKDRFPDGQLYVNMRGFDPAGAPVTPVQVLRRFLHAFGVGHDPWQDQDELADMYRSTVAKKRVLVLLDNAATAEQVRPLLPGSSESLALVTSRRRLSSLEAVEGALALSLDLLTVAEAWELLSRQLGAERLAAEPEAVEKIINWCARLPLALTIVAAAVRADESTAVSLAVVERKLRDAEDPFDMLDLADPVTDVRKAFSLSYGQLGWAAARLFRLLGIHAGPDSSVAAAASLAGVTVTEVQPLLAELTDAHLLEEDTNGRFAFHDLLRAYAAGQAGAVNPESERREAVHRVLDHYLHTAYTASRLWDPHRDPIILTPPKPQSTPESFTESAPALAWLNAEYSVLLRAINLAAEIGFDTHAWQLTWSLVDFFNRQGYWHDWLSVQQIALNSAERLADQSAQARGHRGLGRVYACLDRDQESEKHLRTALELFDKVNDHASMAHTYIDLSRTFERREDYQRALHHSELALTEYDAADSAVGRANALNGVGWYHALLGHYEQTLAYCHRALSFLKELADSAGLAATLDSIGLAHHHLRHYPEAIDCYQQALHLFREEVDHFSEADTLTRLGDTHRAAGDSRSAQHAWQSALNIFDRLSDARHVDQVRTKLHDLDGQATT